MISVDKVSNSPGRIIREKYFKPTGLNLMEFSRELNLPYQCLRLIVLEKSRTPMRLKFVLKLAKATNTCVRDWLEMDQSFWYEKFKRTCRISVLPINLNITKTTDQNASPGDILRNQFSAISRKTGIDKSTIRSICNGQRKINFSIAERLAAGLNTTIWYWMDLQNRYEIKQILTSGVKLTESIQVELAQYLATENHQISSDTDAAQTLKPADVLINKFIRPSKISVPHWCKLLFLTKRNMSRLINGQEELSVTTILKLCAIFNTPVRFWLSVQAKFYAEIQRTEPLGIISSECRLTPLDILKQQLSSARCTIKAFSRHTGLDYRKLYRLRHGHIDFNSATRIGQCLNSDPRYWLKICLDQKLAGVLNTSF